MRDLLAEGMAWLERKRTQYLARQVVYRRGSESVQVAATVGKTIFRLDKGYGVQERIEARDYLILAADLALGGTQVLPKAGDQVRETQNGKVFVYEVLAPGNEPCWRYSDPYRQTLRIHTKLIATESAP
jgi:hypothetical protein